MNNLETAYVLVKSKVAHEMEVMSEILKLLAQIESLFDIISSGEITICHNGDKTKTIPLDASSNHLGHGDTIGTCP